jgi:LCP family protein required for cell wall assembly
MPTAPDPLTEAPEDAAPPARRPWRKILTLVVASQLVVALLTGGLVYAAWQHLNGRIHTGDAIPVDPVAPAPSGPKTPLNILVLGNDSRECPGCSVGDDQKGEGGSDTTILIHLSADRRTATGISIPRDLRVPRIDCTRNAPEAGAGAGMVLWNQAYAVNGADCTAEQLQHTFGIHVDSYIVVNFAGFRDMVQAVDGIDVCISRDLQEPQKYGGHFFPASTSYHLDPDQALAYVRLRHVDGTSSSDPARIRRQQVFVAALISQITSARTLSDPVKLYSLANAMIGSITPSPDLDTTGKLVHLAVQMQKAHVGRISFVTLPFLTPGPGEPGYPHLNLDPTPDKTLAKRLNADQPLGSLAAGSVKVTKPGKGNPQKPPSSGTGLSAAAYDAGTCS